MRIQHVEREFMVLLHSSLLFSATSSRFHVPLAVHLQLEDASPYDFGAAFAIPSGPPGATFSTFLPLR